jgi:hypothetical protein
VPSTPELSSHTGREVGAVEASSPTSLRSVAEGRARQARSVPADPQAPGIPSGDQIGPDSLRRFCCLSETLANLEKRCTIWALGPGSHVRQRETFHRMS